MDPGVKVAAALSVVVTAICLALLFWGNPASLAPATSQPLKLRAESESAITPFHPSRKPDLFFHPLESRPESRRRPTILVPTASSPTAPPCGAEGCPLPAPDRPAVNPEEHASWGTAAGVKMPELRLPPGSEEGLAPRTHTVIDGDMLPDLARRYLGAADRYLEIYQWNSDVLANPDVLPIGQLLRIPPRTAPTPEPASVIQRPMVPVTEDK